MSKRCAQRSAQYVNELQLSVASEVLSDVYLLIVSGNSAIYLLEDFLLKLQKRKQDLLNGVPPPIILCAHEIRAFYMLTTYSLEEFVVKKRITYRALQSEVFDLYNATQRTRSRCMEISVEKLLNLERMCRWVYQDVSVHLGDFANQDCKLGDDSLLEFLQNQFDSKKIK